MDKEAVVSLHKKIHELEDGKKKKKLLELLRIYVVIWVEKSTSINKTDVQIERNRILNETDFLQNSPYVLSIISVTCIQI